MPTAILDYLRSKFSALRPRLLQTVGVVALAYFAFYLVSVHVLPWLAGQSGPSSALPSSLNITTLLQQVKCEVNAATRETIMKGEPAMFQVKELELEINFIISQEAGSKTPTLVPISLETKVASQKVQRIKLTLGPADDIDKPLEGTLSKIERPTDVLLGEEQDVAEAVEQQETATTGRERDKRGDATADDDITPCGADRIKRRQGEAEQGR